MRKRLLGSKWRIAAVASLMMLGGVVYALGAPRGVAASPAGAASGYVCPLTGEDLPCPKCCPLAR